MSLLRSGRLYRVTGANSQSGEDVEITVEAHDESDAARWANRRGVFVSGCVAAGPDGSTWADARTAAPPSTAPAAPPTGTARVIAVDDLTFAEIVARDPVVQRLVRTHPQLGDRVKRLNEEDQAYLSALAGGQMGISYRDAAHVGKLMKNANRCN